MGDTSVWASVAALILATATGLFQLLTARDKLKYDKDLNLLRAEVAECHKDREDTKREMLGYRQRAEKAENKAAGDSARVGAMVQRIVELNALVEQMRKEITRLQDALLDRARFSKE